MTKKKKEKCPYCGKSFVYLDRHKCKQKPTKNEVKTTVIEVSELITNETVKINETTEVTKTNNGDINVRLTDEEFFVNNIDPETMEIRKDNNEEFSVNNVVREIQKCPNCNTKLRYDDHFFDAYCPNCEYSELDGINNLEEIQTKKDNENSSKEQYEDKENVQKTNDNDKYKGGLANFV